MSESERQTERLREIETGRETLRDTQRERFRERKGGNEMPVGRQQQILSQDSEESIYFFSLDLATSIFPPFLPSTQQLMVRMAIKIEDLHFSEFA